MASLLLAAMRLLFETTLLAIKSVASVALFTASLLLDGVLLPFQVVLFGITCLPEMGALVARSCDTAFSWVASLFAPRSTDYDVNVSNPLQYASAPPVATERFVFNTNLSNQKGNVATLVHDGASRPSFFYHQNGDVVAIATPILDTEYGEFLSSQNRDFR